MWSAPWARPSRTGPKRPDGRSGDRVLLDRLSRRPHFTEESELVFGNEVGEVIDNSALRRRFKAALERAGLKPIRSHDLRHGEVAYLR